MRGASFYALPFFAAAAEQGHRPEIRDFVLACWARFGGRRAPRRGLELACGPALDSVDLARAGIDMTAVDACPAMAARAREHARPLEPQGGRVRVRCADMVGFRARPPVDFAINLGLNASYIASAEEMLRHLHAVGGSVRPGGLYLIDFEFGLHRWIRKIVVFDSPWIECRTATAYRARGRLDGRGFVIEFGGGIARYDPIRQLFRSRIRVVVGRGSDRRIAADVPTTGRLYFPLEVRSLVARSKQFDVAGCYAGYSLDVPFAEGSDGARFVVVLRRRRG